MIFPLIAAIVAGGLLFGALGSHPPDSITACAAQLRAHTDGPLNCGYVETGLAPPMLPRSYNAAQP